MAEMFVEIPETLLEGVRDFLKAHPDWDHERLLTAALSLWLLQNGGDRRAAPIYLDSLFQKES